MNAAAQEPAMPAWIKLRVDFNWLGGLLKKYFHSLLSLLCRRRNR